MSTSAEHLGRETHDEQSHVAFEHETSTGLDNRKMVFWLFLGSECMFFGSLLVTYLIYQGKSVVGPYPQDLLDIPLTSVSTFILLMSSLTMVLAVSAGHRHDRKQLSLWLGATIALGLVFLGFQVYEFNHFVHEGLTLSSSLFGSSFYVLTGIHGTHVAVGVLWLASLLLNAVRNRLREPGIVVEIAGLYWHFVDVVWIVIFTVVYLIGAEI